MKWIHLAGGTMLFIGLANLPEAYYTFLRISIVLVAATAIIADRKNGISFWNVVMFAIAVLFNPFFPVHILNEELRQVIYIVCASLFMVKAGTYGKSFSV